MVGSKPANVEAELALARTFEGAWNQSRDINWSASPSWVQVRQLRNRSIYWAGVAEVARLRRLAACPKGTVKPEELTCPVSKMESDPRGES